MYAIYTTEQYTGNKKYADCDPISGPSLIEGWGVLTLLRSECNLLVLTWEPQSENKIRETKKCVFLYILKTICQIKSSLAPN